MTELYTKTSLLDRRMGFALLRVLLGVNMLGRVFVRLPDLDGFAGGMVGGFEDTILPDSFVYAFAFVIVFTESIIGVLLVLGWKTRWALVTMGLLMCVLTFGMLLQQNFGTAANILIYGTAVTVLLFTTQYDYFGIDRGFSFTEADMP